ncbi:MAG: VanW family protein, partial [Clostridia bacterium]|nr:VanW family protein [Clostridia bacterium]
RNANIALAAKSINSAVLMPGETFSFNDLIGECSTRTGYKESTIYMNGELSTGIGGGICQVSTTLYNAVLRSNLEIVERRNHSLGVTYVPAGHDAMVSIGSSDFKFKNNRDYPVKVVAYVGTGSITCEIQGLKQDVEYEVKLESKMIEKTDEKYKVETYKVLYLNGKEVSRTWLSKDTYKYHQ